MLKTIKWVWQLPQNVVGYFLTRKYITVLSRGDGKYIYFTQNVFNCGVSLGDYIILDYNIYYYAYCAGKKYATDTVKHEKGHQKQSLYLGWFYILLVGLPSVCNNLWDRLFHKKWDTVRRHKWYYSRYPEKWADILGGVSRWMM